MRPPRSLRVWNKLHRQGMVLQCPSLTNLLTCGFSVEAKAGWWLRVEEKKKVEITLRFGFELQKSIEGICSRNVVPFLNSLREQWGNSAPSTSSTLQYHLFQCALFPWMPDQRAEPWATGMVPKWCLLRMLGRWGELNDRGPAETHRGSWLWTLC